MKYSFFAYFFYFFFVFTSAIYEIIPKKSIGKYRHFCTYFLQFAYICIDIERITNILRLKLDKGKLPCYACGEVNVLSIYAFMRE